MGCLRVTRVDSVPERFTRGNWGGGGEIACRAGLSATFALSDEGVSQPPSKPAASGIAPRLGVVSERDGLYGALRITLA